jgi:predicted RNA-binding Zn-ribbon protein involved in translation (DUF1610 family)
MKILILDIETAPNLAYVWRFFKENIAPKQVVQNSTILSYCAKWLGEERVMYNDCREDLDEFGLVLELCQLLDEADIVVAHNGVRFDVPKINTACLRNKISPPSPFKQVDTFQVARSKFKFESNKLEHLADHLNLPMKKLAHKKFPGFELWLECLRGNVLAWEEMREYNINDVLVLEKLYLRLLPWIDNHPNIGVVEEKEFPVCPKCGSRHIQHRGYSTTSTGKYKRFRCNSCGGWGRSRYTEYPKDKRRALIVNAV